MSTDLSSLVASAVRDHFGSAAGSTRPVKEAIADFRRSLSDRGRSKSHCREVARNCRRVCLAAKIDTVDQLTEERVVRGLARIARLRPGRCGNKTISSSTVNHYRNSLRGFSRWLYMDRQLPDHRLARLPEFKAVGEKRRRRELSIDDVERLIAAAERGPRVEGMSGPDRAWMYRIAIATGLRRGEISSLTPASFRFTEHGAFVVVSAKFSKRRRDERQPLPPQVVPQLKAWLSGRPEGSLVWPCTKRAGGAERKTSVMVRLDLARAGIDYETDEGVADFHALRVAFVSWLVRSGASPKVVQRCARHSSISLTMDVYAKVGEDEVAAAVAGLPTPGGFR